MGKDKKDEVDLYVVPDQEAIDKDSRLAEVEALRPDLFFPTNWSEDQRSRAIEVTRRDRVRTDLFAMIPMRCRAEKCVFAEICPLMKADSAPKGLPCPLEMAIVQAFFDQYMKEFGVSRDNFVEISMVRDMVDQQVQMMRKTKILSLEHFIQENAIGIDADGKVITQKSLHQAVEYEDKIFRRMEKLRNAFLATREARMKAGSAQLDTAQKVANALDQLREAQFKERNLIKQKLGEADVDEYIEDAIIIDDEDEGDE